MDGIKTPIQQSGSPKRGIFLQWLEAQSLCNFCVLFLPRWYHPHCSYESSWSNTQQQDSRLGSIYNKLDMTEMVEFVVLTPHFRWGMHHTSSSPCRLTWLVLVLLLQNKELICYKSSRQPQCNNLQSGEWGLFWPHSPECAISFHLKPYVNNVLQLKWWYFFTILVLV